MQALLFSPSNDPGILGYRGPLSRKRAIEITAELQLHDERCFVSNSFTGTYMEGSTLRVRWMSNSISQVFSWNWSCILLKVELRWKFILWPYLNVPQDNHYYFVSHIPTDVSETSIGTKSRSYTLYCERQYDKDNPNVLPARVSWFHLCNAHSPPAPLNYEEISIS